MAATGGTAVVTVPIFAGSIAVAPSNPHILYLGTGEGNNTGDSYYGSGVYRSLDGGLTWTLLENTYAPNAVSNPLQGQVINKIIVDPDDVNRIYVATSDRGVFSSLATNPTRGIRASSGASWSARDRHLVTITTNIPHNLTVGQPVGIAGMSPAAYNGSFIVNSVTATTFTYFLFPNPGAVIGLGSLATSITNASWSAGVATITTGTPNTFAVGQQVVISDMVPGGYNGTVLITSVTPTTFTYDLAGDPGTAFTFGTVSNAVAPMASASWSQGTATITTTFAHGLSVGQQVTLSGMTPAGFNGSFIISAVTATTFSFGLTSAGSVVTSITAASWSAGQATLTALTPPGLAIGDQVTVTGMVPAAYNGTFTVTAVLGSSFSLCVGGQSRRCHHVRHRDQSQVATATGLGNTYKLVPVAPGVWRYDASDKWINLTAIVSTNRASATSVLPGPPNSAPPAPIPKYAGSG